MSQTGEQTEKHSFLEKTPMIISDLNYLQTADELVEGGYFFGPNSTTVVNANINEKLNIRKDFFGKTIVIGNFAGAEASALSSGPNTSTQAISYTNVAQGKGSASYATSVSAASPSYGW
ncbi:hypothetical protein H6F89_28855 [Cyanobacteria bacterium FACHB-63]|nr:hypothetical protein [Cyanobacteria bacterium FACHB-63]